MTQSFCEYTEPIFQRILKRSTQVLCNYSSCNELISQQISLDNFHKKRYYWLCIILLKGDNFLLNYMVHYNTLKLYDLSAKSYGRSVEQMSDSKVEQFIKEYSNLMAGSIQALFNKNKMHLEIGIPWVTLGIDRYFQDKMVTPMQSMYSWNILNNDNILLTTSLEMESTSKVLDPWDWNKIDSKDNNESSIGEFEQF